MPVQLTHVAGIDLDQSRRDVRRDLEVAGIGDADVATRRSGWRLLLQMEHHVERYGAKRIVHRVGLQLRGRRFGLEDEALLPGKPVERLCIDGQVFRQRAGVVVGEQVGDRKRAVFRKLAVRKRKEELAAFVRQSLDRMGNAGGEIPEVARSDIGNEIVAVIVDRCDASLAGQHEAHSACLCQCSSRTPPGVRRMLTPAIVVEIANSRCMTSRDQPPSRIFMCASANENRRFGSEP